MMSLKLIYIYIYIYTHIHTHKHTSYIICIKYQHIAVVVGMINFKALANTYQMPS